MIDSKTYRIELGKAINNAIVQCAKDQLGEDWKQAIIFNGEVVDCLISLIAFYSYNSETMKTVAGRNAFLHWLPNQVMKRIKEMQVEFGQNASTVIMPNGGIN